MAHLSSFPCRESVRCLLKIKSVIVIKAGSIFEKGMAQEVIEFGIGTLFWNEIRAGMAWGEWRNGG